MQKFTLYFIIGIIFCSMTLLVGCPSGFEGLVTEKITGRKIPDVNIRFVSEDGGIVKSEISDTIGYYKITLSQGRYWVTATHPDYEDYSSIPGFFVVTAGGYQTGNIFLREPRLTTVLLVRHAEKAAIPPDDPPLTSDGEARAKKLANVAHRAGVTAIYTTDTKRTKGTVEPLADSLKLDPIIYNNLTALVNQILSEHKGDVVLVAGHSPTVPQIARLLGADVPQQVQYLPDFDNLFAITRKTDEANAVNLQYGELSQPDVGRGYNTTIKIRSGTSDGTVLATATTLVPGPQRVGAQPLAYFEFLSPIQVTPGETYVIEWIPPGDKILTWMAAEGDPYSGGTAFGCTGVAIPQEDFIFTTYLTSSPLEPDQVNDAETGKSRGCGTPSGGNLFQSFTPSASLLAAVDLRLRAGGGFPDGGSYPMTTVLLVRHAESGEAGKARAEQLAHVALKAGVTAIYVSPTQEIVHRLADICGLQVNSYDSDDVQELVNKILSDHAGEVVVVAGHKETLSEIIKKLGGSPFPIIYKNEYDNLVVLTVCDPGDAKVVSLQYGESSP